MQEYENIYGGFIEKKIAYANPTVINMVLYQKILALVPVLAAFRTASTSPTDFSVKATSVTSNTTEIIINVDNQVTGTLNATAWSLIVRSDFT